MSEAVEEEMCPNCVTPWKCNGPHVVFYEGERVYQSDPASCIREARQHLWNAEEALRAGDVELVHEELGQVRSRLHPGLEREWDDRMTAWMEREGVPGGYVTADRYSQAYAAITAALSDMARPMSPREEA